MTDLDKGIAALKRGRLDEGASLLQRARKEDPDNPDILYNLGMAYSDMGLLEKALSALEACVKLRGESNDLTALGVAYFRRMDLEKSKEAFERALKLDPNNFYSLRNYGALLSQMGQQEEAIKQYERALGIQPNAVEVMFGIGQVHELRKDISSADEWYKKAIDAGGTHPAREKAKEARTRIAGSEMKKSGFRMDAMMYCLSALRYFEQLDDIKPVVADIALLGQRGLDIHSPEKKYRLKSMEGEFSGMQLLSYMFVGFKLIDPTIDGGIDLEDEYQHALALHEGKGGQK